MDPLTIDPLDVVWIARALVDIDSTTGREAEAGRWLAAYLRGRGWSVAEQPVDSERFNVFASRVERPQVVLSTHLDCVPPFFESRVEDGLLYGRGSCDAKGILAAQLVAAERLAQDGIHIGLLFVVGEERGSDGAIEANRHAVGSAFLVNGEPTDNRLAEATRGILRVRLVATGRAAHSSYPELGESAIERLVDALVLLRRIDMPVDPVLGQTHYTVGTIEGGVAPNVVPPHAEAEVLFRISCEPGVMRARLALLEAKVAIADVLQMPPLRLLTVPGFATAVFPYTTDAALLNNWGRLLLYGPGSVLVAHTDDEHVPIAMLEEAVDGYARLARTLDAAAADGGLSTTGAAS